MVNSWLHVLALVVYLGAIIGLAFMLLPAVSAAEKHEERAQLLARGLKLYNPLQIGALGIILFSGAFQLTQLKAAYRETFIQEFGFSLGIKLLFAFLLVIFSVYQAMGIGHRFVKRHELNESITPHEINSVVHRLKSANWLILILALVTLWFGLRLHP